MHDTMSISTCHVRIVYNHTLIKERNGGLGGTVQINRERRKAKEERKERRHRRVERRERRVDGVVEEDQQGLGNWKHRSDEEGR